MLTVSEPLAKFFAELFPAAHRAGYKLVVTLLAREADSENVFRDVERYWSSLHDLTGDHVLFALGAHKARRLDATGRGIVEHPPKQTFEFPPHARQKVGHICPDAALVGRRGLSWEGPGYQAVQGEGALQRNVHELRMGNEEAAKNVAISHSLEVTSLRTFFGLREEAIPAVLLIILEPDSRTAPVIVPMSTISSTIYHFLKRLIDAISASFDQIDKCQLEQLELQKALSRIDRSLGKVEAIFLWLSSDSVSADAKKAANEILAISIASIKKSEAKHRCYELLQWVAVASGKHSDVTKGFQSLIDRSFSSEAYNYQEAHRGKRGLLNDLRKAKAKENLLWSRVREELLNVSSDRADADSTSWKVFICYPSEEHWYAERIYRSLSKYTSVFLDRFCLRPGDKWAEKISAAQDKALCTVIVINGTRGTGRRTKKGKGWYAEAEYLRAIELARRGSHRIIPVLIGTETKLPYGLEQVQCLRVPESTGDFESIAKQLVRAIHD